MILIKAERYFKTIKHPLGDGLYIKIGAEFKSKEDAEKFETMKMGWEEDVQVIEVSQEEYLENIEVEDLKRIRL